MTTDICIYTPRSGDQQDLLSSQDMQMATAVNTTELGSWVVQKSLVAVLTQHDDNDDDDNALTE